MDPTPDAPPTILGCPSKKCMEVLLGVLIVLVIVLIAYQMGWFNAMLPKDWKKSCKSNFVGHLAGPHYQQPSMVFMTKAGKFPIFNAATYV